MKIAGTVLLLLLDDESCFEKDGYQTCSWKSLISVKISEIRVFPIDCHAALSKTKSQKRVVMLREVKRNRRIYWRTDNGFCNSGRKRPPCRMTRWMADNEFKNPRFCEIHRLPKKIQIFQRTLFADPVILREAKRSRRISPLSKHQHNSLKIVPPQLNFQPDFQVFLRTFKNPKKDFSSIDSVTSIIKTIIQSLFPGKIVSTLL